MKIIGLRAENVKRLKAVEIRPDGSTVVIGGLNAQGKSSVLDCILMGLGGKSTVCDEPLRRGSKAGEINLDLDDYTVRRGFTSAGNTSLTVRAKDGSPVGSPQELLNSLTGSLTFDPLAFIKQDAGKQIEILKNLVGLDFTSQNTTRQRLYDERTQVGREVTSKKAIVEQKPYHPDAPDTELSLADLLAQAEAASAANAAHAQAETARGQAAANLEGAKSTLAQLMAGGVTPALQTLNTAIADDRRAVDRAANEVADLERQLAKAKTRLAEAEATLAKRTTDLATARTQAVATAEATVAASAKALAAAEAAKANTTTVAMEPIQTRMRDAEAINRKVRENTERAAAEADLDAAQALYARLSSEIAAIDRAKEEALAAARFPIPNLSFNDTGVTFNGLPLKQASTAEQLRIGVAIGLALNPKLKVVLIRDGSALDPDSLKSLASYAADRDAQVWIERVSTGDEVSVIIEDGMVVESGLAAAG